MPSAHLHLMVRAEIVNPPGVNDVEAVVKFMTDLVDRVRMKVLMPARALWCDEPGNEGITGDVLLTTSNSVVHIWNYEDNTGLLEFDLYSCAPFTPEEVVEYINERFEVTKLAYKFIDRMSDLIDITPCDHPEMMMEYDGPFPVRLYCNQCDATIEQYGA